MSFMQSKRVQFVDVLATPPADRERYGALYPSVAQLKTRADRRSSSDLYWGKHPLSSTGHTLEDESGDRTFLRNDAVVDVAENAEAAQTPIITLTAAVGHQLTKSITSLSITTNPRRQHPLSRSWGHEDMIDSLSPPDAGPPSLFAGSSSGFTTSSCATTPDQDIATPYFTTYASECNTSSGAGIADVSVFEHLGNQ